MIIIGLTGSIASGKSTVVKWLSERHIKIHDADAVVHSLLSTNGKGVLPIVDKFGVEIMKDDGSIDRKKLGNHVFANPKRREDLESILHPMVKDDREKFLEEQQSQGSKIVVLDVPLLFETGAEALCDYVVVVYASDDTIKNRALSRYGMTDEKLKGILAAQIKVEDKISRADLSLDTDLDFDETQQQLFLWLDKILFMHK